MVFCENCGKQLNEWIKFCNECGASVGESAHSDTRRNYERNPAAGNNGNRDSGNASWYYQPSANAGNNINSGYRGDNVMNYELNRLYFFPTPPRKIGAWPFILIGISILLLILQSDMYREIKTIFLTFGIVLLIAGIIWLISIFVLNENRTVVTDSEYDEAVFKKFKIISLMKEALEKIGIDEDQLKEIPPIFVHGFRSDKDSAEKIGKDGKLRTSKYDATVMFFSASQIYIYQQVFDMLEGVKLEYTLEYFYRDIVSFFTSTKTSDKNNVKVTGVSTFTLIVPNDEFSCSMSGISDADMIISAMKQMLREKKI